MGIWKSHDKAQVKSLDARGSVGYLLDVDIWQSGATRIMQDGIVVKGLAPKLLDPCRSHINPRKELSNLEAGMPWRTMKDEFSKFKWIDHEDQEDQGTPYALEPDATAQTVFIASVMRTQMHSPVLQDTPDVTCPPTYRTTILAKKLSIMRKLRTPGQSRSKKKNSSDKKSNFTIKAKSIPVTPKAVAESTGLMREKWLLSIYKETESFLQNMAITDADPMEKSRQVASTLSNGLRFEALDTDTTD